MNDVALIADPQPEQEPATMYATIDITYDNEVVLETDKGRMRILQAEYDPIAIIENYLPTLTNELAKRLTSALQIEISVIVLEVGEGSVKVKLGILIRNSAIAIILGVAANLATDEVKAFLADPPPEAKIEIAKYEERCKTTETISVKTLKEFDHIHFKSSEYKVETKSIETICASSKNS